MKKKTRNLIIISSIVLLVLLSLVSLWFLGFVKFSILYDSWNKEGIVTYNPSDKSIFMYCDYTSGIASHILNCYGTRSVFQATQTDCLNIQGAIYNRDGCYIENCNLFNQQYNPSKDNVNPRYGCHPGSVSDPSDYLWISEDPPVHTHLTATWQLAPIPPNPIDPKTVIPIGIVILVVVLIISLFYFKIIKL